MEVSGSVRGARQNLQLIHAGTRNISINQFDP
jgi:hypothetical protein